MVKDSMNKEEKKEEVNTGHNQSSTLQIILYIVGIIILAVCLLTGYNLMSMQVTVSSASLNSGFYSEIGKFVIGMGFFAGFPLWGFAYLIKKQ